MSEIDESNIGQVQNGKDPKSGDLKLFTLAAEEDNSDLNLCLSWYV